MKILDIPKILAKDPGEYSDLEAFPGLDEAWQWTYPFTDLHQGCTGSGSFRGKGRRTVISSLRWPCSQTRRSRL